MRNNHNNVYNGLYKMKDGDLIISGGHSVLVDNYPDNLPYRVFYKGKYMIQDKYLLLACDSNLFEKVIDDNIYTVYHIVLESEDDKKQYGIYANDILSESTSLVHYKTINFIDL